MSDQMGVSGGSIEHVLNRARAYCYTGTLGALVKDASGAEYMLSNNHVLAKENDPDNSLEPDGNIMIQPGLLDEGACSLSLGDPSHRVGYLADWVPLQFGKGKNPPENIVDAAIASNEGMSAEILGIGGLSDNTVAAPPLGLAVQKSGRTTGHTFGQVTAVDVTLTVDYSSGQARFVNQLELTGTCMNFSDSGDSGSVIVTVPASTSDGADAVGLLFAGGGDLTFANPINTVLEALTVTQPPLTMVASAAGTESGALTDQMPDPALCGDEGDAGGPPSDPPGRGNKKNLDHPAIANASAVALRHSAALLATPGVYGHGIGLNTQGDPVIRVYTDKAARRPASGTGIPAALDGVAVMTVPTGPIRAY
ncbi:hypothetical protein Q9290_11805 [Oceanimonas sp. CHS3-5]|uniref:hypothetical protein n=1 Tax=Oceanimonas sp. CHS3-5 TaxID=3068186 RepID=UPI0027402402|nr:hypothetical protein [Oceanimonas sp. CHS3-5]MDP5292966.1 hypothetical protein [Oceanimonas sp. CHS3-5]